MTTQSNPISGWPEERKWLMGLAASLLVSGIAGWISAQYTIRSETVEGRAVFTNIGIRYFDALLGAFDLESGQASDNQAHWNAYRRTLEDLREDIRWLLTNPLYEFIQADTQDLVLLQNRLVMEVESTDFAADRRTLSFMCSVFVQTGELERAVNDEDVVGTAIRDFARESCRLLEHQPG